MQRATGKNAGRVGGRSRYGPQTTRSSPITTNILIAHRESTARLNLLVAGRDKDSFQEVVRFRNLRTRLHQLTDKLVACFLPIAPVGPFAHNAEEATRLGEQAASRLAAGGDAVEWRTLSSEIATLRHECGESGPNDLQNYNVAAAAMGLFAPEMFDSYGLLRTTWLRRLERVGDETTVLMEQWLGLENSTGGDNDRRWDSSLPFDFSR